MTTVPQNESPNESRPQLPSPQLPLSSPPPQPPQLPPSSPSSPSSPSPPPRSPLLPPPSWMWPSPRPPRSPPLSPEIGTRSRANMEIATLLLNTIVPEVLGEDNYERWSILIKHYLVAQDVWDVVDPNPWAAEINAEINERVWNKKNALALHAIEISCGAEVFDRIRNLPSARDAWTALRDMHVHEFVPSDEDIAASPPHQRDVQSILHDCIYKGIQSEVEHSPLIEDPRMLKYALHVAITAGQEDIACFLYGKMIEMIEMIERGEFSDEGGEFSDEDYFILLEECITKKMLKISWDLLNRFPELATNEPPQRHMPIILTLAKTPPPFFERSQLKFVRLWIYHCIEVNVELIRPSDPAADALEEELWGYQSCLQFLMAQLRKLVTPLLKILGKQPRLRKINH